MATARELGPEGWRPYIEAAKVRPPRPPLTHDEATRRRRLLRKARQASALLRSAYGARRVVLFGSLAHKAWLTTDSDLDLAVEGLPPRVYFRAWDEVERLVGEARVDLIDVAEASPSLRAAIEREGMEL